MFGCFVLIVLSFYTDFQHLKSVGIELYAFNLYAVSVFKFDYSF